MKIIEERETKKIQKKKGYGSYSERVRAKWFYYAFMLDFL